MKNITANWYLVTIDDPDFVIGESIYKILSVILKKIEFKYVILEDIIGSPKVPEYLGLISDLQEQMDTPLVLKDFLPILNVVKQFDWGDFFLFKEFPKNWNPSENYDYPYVIAQSNTTVRAIDNQYIYVYTPYEELVDWIKSKYEIESLKSGSLEELDYPY